MLLIFGDWGWAGLFSEFCSHKLKHATGPVPGVELLSSLFVSCASCAFHHLLIFSTGLENP